MKENNPRKTVKRYRIGNCIIENVDEIKQITLENNRNGQYKKVGYQGVTPVDKK